MYNEKESEGEIEKEAKLRGGKKLGEKVRRKRDRGEKERLDSMI